MDQNELNEPPPGTGAATAEWVEQVGGPARRLVLAGIGAVASVVDTAEQSFDQFVERGEQVRSEWRDRADEVRHQNVGARGRVRDYFRTAMDTFLDGINVPNKADVDTINVKLNILSRKLDDLQIQQVRVTNPGQPETPPGEAVPPPDTDMAT
jgi:poly(hydroxyalkanoate) granule-associated protein